MKKYFVFFVISVIIFFSHAIYTKHAIYGDGNGYYSYTQALYFEKSLNFKPIYNYLSNFPGRNYIFSRVFWGSGSNPFPVGTGIVWLPSMFFMSFFSSDRFSLTYELGPGLMGILFMLGGLYFIEKNLLRSFSKNAVFWTILVLFGGSSIFYYTALEPALSHQPAFFLISFLLYLSGSKKIIHPIILGILSGLLSIVRIPDTILLIPIILSLKLSAKGWASFLLGFALAASPQVINQSVQYGGILINPYLTGQSGTWQVNLLHSLEYLFSPIRGLFVWTPIFLVGIWGLIKLKAKNILITFLIMWLVSSSWSAYLSAGFGQRFMFSFYPYLAVGIAFLFNRLKNMERMLYSIPFVVWNFTLLAGFYILRIAR